MASLPLIPILLSATRFFVEKVKKRFKLLSILLKESTFIRETRCFCQLQKVGPNLF